MSDQPPDPHGAGQIIIIRRASRDDHEGHHGGVWKIAFADFMTAMMAFFLVLWIVNSTSKETRVSIARYFNPIKLVDATPMRRGVRTSSDGEYDASEEEAKVRSDPGESHGSSKSASSGGDAPKPPAAATNDKARSVATSEATPEPARAPGSGRLASQGLRAPASANEVIGVFRRSDLRSPTPPEAPPAISVAQPVPVDASVAAVQPTSTPAGLRPASPAGSDAAFEPSRTSSTAQAIRRELANALGSLAEGGKGPKLDVVENEDGVLIRLTDGRLFSMFAVGSSRPNPSMEKYLTEIAAIIGRHDGMVIVRGYTDGRTYKGDDFDNWRLSVARAHSAMKALVRNGVSESRTDHIEGYADRKPAVTTDAQAAENRRIEIVLKSKAGSR